MHENIQISDGLQFYYANNQQQVAIDQIIGQSKIPNDLTWKDIGKFNDARLSAHSVQVDYWKLVNTIWEQTWGEAVDTNKYRSVDPTFYEREYALGLVWDNYLYKAFEYNHSILYMFCAVYDEKESGIKIGFNVEDENGSYDVSSQLPLSENWLKEIDSERLVVDGLVPIKGKSEINTDILSKLAKEAMTQLENVL